MPENTRLYSVNEAMCRLNLSRSTLYSEMGSGRLRSVTVGRRRLITPCALADYIQSLAEASGIDGLGSYSWFIETAAETDIVDGSK
ncbi:helix-turn-helix domain-containing protein [Mycobacterium colombiense]|uniref:helix-turn-helix domain-containing protein n=1 Tax=Mycobacterium colombiense TaxID=339268 RepID=UPI0007FD7FE5|nr:helix-turn-helix domain-containing protein [Mycobacterium colombiense]OBJ21663.1 hypothetical protein A9W93_14075 [Mycobacterium colombiense]